MIGLLLIQSISANNVPDPLLRFEAARDAIRYADIEWAFTSDFEKPVPKNTMHYRALFAESDVAIFPFGTETGVTGWRENESGQLEPLYDPPVAALRQGPESWSRPV